MKCISKRYNQLGHCYVGQLILLRYTKYFMCGLSFLQSMNNSIFLIFVLSSLVATRLREDYLINNQRPMPNRAGLRTLEREN